MAPYIYSVLYIIALQYGLVRCLEYIVDFNTFLEEYEECLIHILFDPKLIGFAPPPILPVYFKAISSNTTFNPSALHNFYQNPDGSNRYIEAWNRPPTYVSEDLPTFKTLRLFCTVIFHALYSSRLLHYNCDHADMYLATFTWKNAFTGLPINIVAITKDMRFDYSPLHKKCSENIPVAILTLWLGLVYKFFPNSSNPIRWIKNLYEEDKLESIHFFIFSRSDKRKVLDRTCIKFFGSKRKLIIFGYEL